MKCSNKWCKRATKNYLMCLYHRKYNRKHRRKWFKKNPHKLVAYRQLTRRWQSEVRKKVFDHYGTACLCCGEREPMFLSLDHIENDGAVHRRSLKRAAMGLNFYRWLIRNNFPSVVQTLCMNCNHGKSRNQGVCPHINNDGIRLVAR